jgi:hypothetical protein
MSSSGEVYLLQVAQGRIHHNVTNASRTVLYHTQQHTKRFQRALRNVVLHESIQAIKCYHATNAYKCNPNEALEASRRASPFHAPNVKQTSGRM